MNLSEFLFVVATGHFKMITFGFIFLKKEKGKENYRNNVTSLLDFV